MKFRQGIACAALAALSMAWGIAHAVDTPASLEGATVVSAEQAKDLIAKGTPIFDVRSANEFAEGHIKGAKNAPYKEKSEKKIGFDASLDSFDLAKLPGDKAAPMIMYCNGIDCWKSYKAATVAIRSGYKKISWLRGGLPDWKGKGYPVE